jgi:hypothetical protein
VTARVLAVATLVTVGLSIPPALARPPGGARLGPLLSGSLGRDGRSAQILRFAQRWLGTPYQWGGTAKSGIDCSAYLRQMYRDLFQVELPRTTKQQIHLGVDLPVRPKNLARGLEPGDVIFYVNRAGIPNHVVVYAGHGKITHSVSGRGVVIEPIRKLYGRRVVARRFLYPAKGGERAQRGDRFAPIPAAGPLEVTEIPCPPEFRPRRSEVRRFARAPIDGFERFAERELCDLRVLAEALEENGGRVARDNAKRLRDYAEFVNRIETLKSAF